MEKRLLFFGILLLLFSFSLHGQKDGAERTLTHYLLQYCGWNEPVDSVRVLEGVKYINRLYRIKRLKFVHSDIGISQFLPFGRVLKINLDNPSRVCELYGAEMGHAAQFSERPLHYACAWLSGGFAALFRSFFLSKKERAEVDTMVVRGSPRWKARLWVAYKRQYLKVGSMEWDAHAIREPMIREQILLAISRFPVGIAKQ